jgi:autotransporter-associated beta strand protein
MQKIMHSRPSAVTRSAAVLLGLMAGQSLHANDVIKANNTDALNLTSSWVGGSAPTNADVAVWDSTVIGANTVSLGADTSWSGIKVSNPGGLATISAGNTLTLGSAGVDMSAATQNLTLNSALVIGSIQTWNVASSRTLTVGGAISGSSQITKSGAGTLTLGAASTFTGGIAHTEGTLTLNNSTGAGTSSSIITMSDAATLRIGNSSTFIANPVTVSGTNANVNISTANATGGYSSLITGTSGQTVTITGVTAVNFSSSNSKQLQNFVGTVTINSGSALAFRGTSLNNGGDNTTFNVNGGLSTRNGGAVALGALTGSGTVGMGTSGTAGVALTYTIGAKNIDASFSGVIQDGNTATNYRVNVIKTGTGMQTFSGSNTYTGTTAVNGGKLNVTGSLANSTVTVGASGTLAGTGTIGGLTTVNGALRPNTSPLNDTSRLTFSTGLTLASTATTTFDIDGANFTGVTLSTTESLAYNGALSISFTGTAVPGTYDLFNFTDSNTGSFTGVSIAGSYSIPALTNNSGIWSGNNGGLDFVFTQSTGDLVISVPEPSAFALLAGLAGMGCVGLRRRRRA